MVALCHLDRFIAPVKAGVKVIEIGIRVPPRPMAGERIEHFAGADDARTRIIPDTICTAVLPIAIRFEQRLIDAIEVGEVPVRDLDAFARRTGFRDLVDMSTFWTAGHAASVRDGQLWHGLMLEWSPPGSITEAAS